MTAVPFHTLQFNQCVFACAGCQGPPLVDPASASVATGSKPSSPATSEASTRLWSYQGAGCRKPFVLLSILPIETHIDL